MAGEPLELLQLAALFHASRGSASQVFSVCDVADFEPGHQQALASVIVGLMNEGEVSPLAVLDRCGRVGADLVRFYTTNVRDEQYATPGYCANAVREAAIRRRVTGTVARAYQHLTESSRPVEEVVADLEQSLEEVNASMESGVGVVDFDGVMATEDDARPWVMPGMLRSNERLMLTGKEGGGKSVLVSQMCLGAAMGVNTLSFDYTQHEPARVLMLDVENDRLQVRDNMRKVYPYLAEITGNRTPSIEWVDVRDIDLSDSVERQKIIRLAKERQPQLMYMGSLYKLAPEGEKVDAQFYAITRVVDRIRAETGTSIIIEAHTGHGVANDRNGNMRPYGSSMWMRWPEFGLAMIQNRDKPVRIKSWRGHRSEDREWPAGLRRGTVLPWTPIMDDEWDALYGLDD